MVVLVRTVKFQINKLDVLMEANFRIAVLMVETVQIVTLLRHSDVLTEGNCHTAVSMEEMDQIVSSLSLKHPIVQMEVNYHIVAPMEVKDRTVMFQPH